MEIIEGKLSLVLGTPAHGWLPVTLRCGSYSLELDVSDVPNNPIDELMSSLMHLSEKKYKSWGPQETILHLEPFCFYLLIERNGTNFDLLISQSKDFDGRREPVQTIRGTFQEIILPIYRSLMHFFSFGYQAPHWPPQQQRSITELKGRIKSWEKDILNETQP